jgi:DNA-binding beta-propeller fold protein YncE
MGRLFAKGTIAIGFVLLPLLLPTAAWGSTVICPLGSGAGQCENPQNITLDATAQRLYVADQGNNRIDVFNSATGAFVKAFGYGVSTGNAALETCKSICGPGIAGEAAGQFANPWGVAVDNDPASASYHDLYVAELGVGEQHPRVQKLDPLAGPGEEGVEFLLMFGGGVDKTIPGNVCTAAPACGAGSNGGAEGEFSTNRSGVYVGVGPSETVYVVDTLWAGDLSKGRLQRFTASGAVIPSEHILFESNASPASGLAVDSTGDLWSTGGSLTEGSRLRKFEANGTELKNISTGGTGVGGITVDPANDHVFIGLGFGAQASAIEFSADGTVLRRFGYGSLQLPFSGLALAPGGASVFASESFNGGTGRILEIPFSPPGPVVFPGPCSAGGISSISATLTSEVNPEGEEARVHYELVTDAHFQAEGFANSTRVPAQPSDDAVLDGEPGQAFPLFELEKANVEATNLIPKTKYHCRVVATNGAVTATGAEGKFETRDAPEFGNIWASGVGTEQATLSGEVDPVGVPETKGFFEYVSDAAFQSEGGFEHAQRLPVGGEELDFGSGTGFQTRSVQITGLEPGALYHYRIIATDEAIAPVVKASEEQTFRTFEPLSSGVNLPDGRAWELVSPDQKNTAEVGTPGRAGGLFFEEHFRRILAASLTGDAFTYTSWTSFGEPQGAPSSSQYLAKRGSGGWNTNNISPPGFMRNATQPPYFGFTPDLVYGAFVVDEPALAPGAQEGTQNMYLRNDGTGALRALTTQAPEFVESSNLNTFCTALGGVSGDGSRVFFAADGAMVGAPAGIGFSLYEHTPGHLQLVSILPDGTPASPTEATGYGAGASGCNMDQSIVANAVSSDGRIAFWTYGGKYKTAQRPLLARVNGFETQQLDAKAAGGTGSGEGKFWGASADGSKAFFTDTQKLISGASSGDLYRYEVRKPAGERLTDVAPGAEVKGVLGVSPNGAYIYFVGGGVLGAEEGAAGEHAEPGKSNLYVYHEGETPAVHFIARLSQEDSSAWSPSPELHKSQVAGNGDLAFLSIETKALSGYDNVILHGQTCFPSRFGDEYSNDNFNPHCAEAYLYNASAQQLYCVSCNPSHARPFGPTDLPAFTNPLAGPRYLSDDGSRLFFESRDALSAGDEDSGRRDVYEFERAGSGSCTAHDPGFDPASNGCLSLISSGRSSDNSYILDASADGRDVFFGTRERLLPGWDTNANYDIYDAREAGGFPEPPVPPAPCEEEACKPPASAPPPQGTSPSTQNFQGPGNPKQKKPKGHKKHRKLHKHKAKKGAKGKRVAKARRTAR